MLYKWIYHQILNIGRLSNIPNFSNNNIKSSKYSIKFNSFLIKLIVSYCLIIIICISIMGTLSYKFVRSNIKERAIKSNNNLLNQFRNTADSLILGNINELSLKMLQDAQTIPYISYYFSNSLENHIVDTLQVDRYLSNLKTVNPMLYSLAYYFDKSDLLVSTEFIRHTLYEKIETQKILQYYYNLVNSADNTNKIYWYVDHNYGINKYKHESDIVNDIIHMVRVIPGNNGPRKRDGAIIVSIKEDVFYSIIKKAAGDDLDGVMIIDSQGIIVSHTQKEFLGHSIEEFEYGTNIMTCNNSSQNYFIVPIEGVPSVVSYCGSNYTDWKYITITPMEKYTGTASFFIKIIIFIALVTIIIGSLLSAVSARKLNNPLKKLVYFCKGISNAPESIVGNEYSIIHSAINNLTEKIKEQEEKFSESIPILKTNFIHNLLSGNIYDMQEIPDKMELLNVCLPYVYFYTIIIKVKNLNIINDIEDLARYEYEKVSITSHLVSVFDTKYSKCLCCEKDNNLVVILNTNYSAKKILGLINKSIEYRGSCTSVSLYAVLGEAADNIAHIHLSYLSATKTLRYIYVYPEKSIISFDEISHREAQSCCNNTLILKDFDNYFKELNKDKTISSLEKIIAELMNGNYNIDEVNKILLMLISIIEDFIVYLGVDTNSIGYNSRDVIKKFNKFDNIIEFKNWLTICIINNIFGYMESKQSEKNTEIVAKAQEFIHNNIQDFQLSLSTVADAVGVSQSHLSRIFKNIAGSTFIDYVTNLKLEYCKELLLSTNLKIEDISSKMGYSTPQYFISRFKKKYGYTPNEYRNKNNINIVNGFAKI